MHQQKYAEAVADLSKVLLLDPTQKVSHRVRAEAYYRLGRYEESLADLEEFRRSGGQVEEKTMDALRRLVHGPTLELPTIGPQNQ